MTTLERNVEQAFFSAEDIQWMHGYLRGVLDGGTSDRAQLELVLEHVYKKFLDDGNERLADLVLDGLDFLTGWCGPGMEIPQPQAS